MGSGQISLDSTAHTVVTNLVSMISYLVTLLLVLPALVHGQDYDDYEVDPNAIEGLPASAADLLDAPYDDVNNGCKVFHICNPVYDNDGVVERMDKYSFVCGEGTQFDQQTLTCNYPEDAFPCEESPSLYGAVEFGKIPEDY